MIHYSKNLWDEKSGEFREGFFEERGGRIQGLEFGKPPSSATLEFRDWKDAYLGPAFVDLHVHARDFDESHKETLQSLDAAAVKGGVVLASCLANSKPRMDRPERLQEFFSKAESCRARFIPFAAVTKNLEGQEDTDWEALAGMAIAGFSDDGRPIEDEERMARLMKFCAKKNLLISLHEEDLERSHGSCLHDGPSAMRWGVWGSPACAEDRMVERDLNLLRRWKTPLHFAHMSSAAAVQRLTQAKQEGLEFSAELTPHHGLLEAREVDRWAAERLSEFKVCPPVRNAEDRAALLQALREGVLDCVATDHAPHSFFEKSLPIEAAAPGYSSIEYFFTFANELRLQAALSWRQFYDRSARRPAELLRCEKDLGSLEKGREASFVVFHPEAEVSLSFVASKSQNGPWPGRKLRGQLISTWIRGREVYSL